MEVYEMMLMFSGCYETTVNSSEELEAKRCVRARGRDGKAYPNPRGPNHFIQSLEFTMRMMRTTHQLLVVVML